MKNLLLILILFLIPDAKPNISQHVYCEFLGKGLIGSLNYSILYNYVGLNIFYTNTFWDEGSNIVHIAGGNLLFELPIHDNHYIELSTGYSLNYKDKNVFNNNIFGTIGYVYSSKIKHIIFRTGGSLILFYPEENGIRPLILPYPYISIGFNI